jgi:hypothetical protein
MDQRIESFLADVLALVWARTRTRSATGHGSPSPSGGDLPAAGAEEAHEAKRLTPAARCAALA